MNRANYSNVFSAVIMALIVTISSCGGDNGKKVEIGGTNITLRIGYITVEDENIVIPLLVDGPYPVEGGNIPFSMRIEVDGAYIFSSYTKISGTIKNWSTQQGGMFGKGAEMDGHFAFIFPTTKIPNKVIVYVSDGKNVRNVRFDRKSYGSRSGNQQSGAATPKVAKEETKAESSTLPDGTYKLKGSSGNPFNPVETMPIGHTFIVKGNTITFSLQEDMMFNYEYNIDGNEIILMNKDGNPYKLLGNEYRLTFKKEERNSYRFGKALYTTF